MERLVLCNTGTVLNINCQFGVVYNVTGVCKCNDTVLVSEATFLAASAGYMTLSCSDGQSDEQQISISLKGITDSCKLH